MQKALPIWKTTPKLFGLLPTPKVYAVKYPLARPKHESLGYPSKLWTLEGLQMAFWERLGVHLSDSTIWEWVEAEGFHWKRSESWFHEAEKADPEFVEKRGALSRPTTAPYLVRR